MESRALAITSPPGRKATDLLHIVNRSVARLDGWRKRREVTLRSAQLSVAYCEPGLRGITSRRRWSRVRFESDEAHELLVDVYSHTSGTS